MGRGGLVAVRQADRRAGQQLLCAGCRHTGLAAVAGADAAFDVIRAAQFALAEMPLVGELADDLACVEALAWHARGQSRPALQAVGRAPTRPAAQVVRAALALETHDDAAVGGLTEERPTWLAAERLAADVLVACADGCRSGLRAAIDSGRAMGLVGPFLGLGRRAAAELRSLPLEELHPALARALQHTVLAGSAPALIEPLTERELTIVELLPTHLSYAEIGTRLALSVNTVKSNLKAVYRKLDVSSRSEAVAAARAARRI